MKYLIEVEPQAEDQSSPSVTESTRIAVRLALAHGGFEVVSVQPYTEIAQVVTKG